MAYNPYYNNNPYFQPQPNYYANNGAVPDMLNQQKMQYQQPQPQQMPTPQPTPVYAPPVSANVETPKGEDGKAIKAISVLLAIATIVTMLMSWITTDIDERMRGNDLERESVEMLTEQTVFETSEMISFVHDDLEEEYEEGIWHGEMNSEAEDVMDKVSLGNTALMIVKILVCAAIVLLAVFACLVSGKIKGAVLAGILGNIVATICSVGVMIAIGVMNSSLEDMIKGEVPVEMNMGIGLILTLVFAVVNVIVIIAGRKKLN